MNEKTQTQETPSSASVSTQSAEAIDRDGRPDLAEDLAHLRTLLEQHDVDGAREFVKELEQRWPDSDRVRHWAHVLAPPVARRVPGSGGRSLRRERAWLRQHAREYPGCWLAVFEDRLIAADPDLGVVLDTVRQTPGAEASLIHFQHGSSE